MPLTKTARAEPLPGYRLIEPLGKGGFGEVWKCEAPGGIYKAVKIIGGGDHIGHEGPPLADLERSALQRIKDIRHPFLLSLDRVELVNGELIVVMELADQSLFDLLESCQDQCQPGLPREELLGYLWEAAEVLDVMSVEYGLQHLDIKPQNLFL